MNEQQIAYFEQKLKELVTFARNNNNEIEIRNENKKIKKWNETKKF